MTGGWRFRQVAIRLLLYFDVLSEGRGADMGTFS